MPHVKQNPMPRRKWLRLRGDGGTLAQFLRGLGRVVELPRVKQGAGRNGAKAAKRAAR